MKFIEETAPPRVTMRAYVSGLFPAAPGQWRTAWILVEVEPAPGGATWMATLALDELVRELRHRPGHPLRDGIAYAWSHDRFVLDLGPARLTGSVPSWRLLLRELLADAGNTSELHETPAARPWRGVPTAVPVEGLVTPSASSTVGPALSDTDALVAAELGLDPRELLDLVGVGWRRHLHDGREARHDQPTADAAVYVWGEPAQLAVVPEPVVDHAAPPDPDLWDDAEPPLRGALVGVPHPTWDGLVEADRVTHGTVLDPWDADQLAATVRLLRGRRRRAFGFCAACGTYSAPEGKQGGLCWGCAAAIHGWVY